MFHDMYDFEVPMDHWTRHVFVVPMMLTLIIGTSEFPVDLGYFLGMLGVFTAAHAYLWHPRPVFNLMEETKWYACMHAAMLAIIVTALYHGKGGWEDPSYTVVCMVVCTTVACILVCMAYVAHVRMWQDQRRQSQLLPILIVQSIVTAAVSQTPTAVVVLTTCDPPAHERCSICLRSGAVGDEEWAQLRCQGHHKYHADCITSWFTTCNVVSCPLCRGDASNTNVV